MGLANVWDEARLAVLNAADRAAAVAAPTVRIGVTGLSRAGKTVFITALVHNLLNGGRLPLFKAWTAGRITAAVLNPQPDDAVPRFDYETHVGRMIDDRQWPESTKRISELRVTLAYESASMLGRALHRNRLHLDIVDYPGEWLLDLPLLAKDFAGWSAEAVARAARSRLPEAAAWLARLNALGQSPDAEEAVARDLAAAFTAYLQASRSAASPALVAPGRFLAPGDLEGSPALTFSPLAEPTGGLAEMMARRFEAYKSYVVRPFFRDHFARLDRQIVLVDALPALNAGADALTDLQAALAEVLAVFRSGRNNWWSALFRRRIGRILIAATKADHLHHRDHDRLERTLSHLLQEAIGSARHLGAEVDVLALASVRSTREASVVRDGDRLPAIVGTPLAGASIDGETFGGDSEIALFPGDLPDDPSRLTAPLDPPAHRFLAFRPPVLEKNSDGRPLSLPHIRLDRAIEFLIGDYLK